MPCLGCLKERKKVHVICFTFLHLHLLSKSVGDLMRSEWTCFFYSHTKDTPVVKEDDPYDLEEDLSLAMRELQRTKYNSEIQDLYFEKVLFSE